MGVLFKKSWTEEQVKFLEEHSDMKAREIAEILGKTTKAVAMKRYALTHPCLYHSGDEAYKITRKMSQAEKVFRIESLAEEMRVKLLG